MFILIDSREKKKELERITAQFDRLGVKYDINKLYVGDYMATDNAKLIVDRKKDLQELCGNVTQQHERFVRELVKAKDAGIQLVILLEHGNGIKCLEDIYFWKNPRRVDHKFRMVNGQRKYIYIPEHKRATSGETLYKILCSIRDKYGVVFEFCDKSETGEKIVKLLGGGSDG